MATSTNKPSALKPPSQLSKLSAQFGLGSRPLTANERPPALPPKLRTPTSHLPTYNSTKLLGSKSIGNVSAAVSSEISSVPKFTTNTANSCDNLTKPRSAASDASSLNLSSASSVSSFKKGSNLGQANQSSRLLSTRSAFFEANRLQQGQSPADSRFSNRSSSSSNISADSGHNSSSSPGPISSKSTHNLSPRQTQQATSLLPTSKTSIHQLTSKTGNMQTQKPQTAHIVSTPGPVIVDRGAAAISSNRLPNLPKAASQFPSMTKFAAHQSQIHSQRMQFFGAAPTVTNGHQVRQQVNNSHTYGPTIAVPVTKRVPALKSPAHHGKFVVL